MSSRDKRSLQAKYNEFSWSQPVGYDFQEVTDAIAQYKKTLSDMEAIIQKKEEIINALKAANDDYITQLTNVQMQMESVMTPSITPEESLEVLNDFSTSDFQQNETPEETNQKTHQVPRTTPINRPRTGTRNGGYTTRRRTNSTSSRTDSLPIIE